MLRPEATDSRETMQRLTVAPGGRDSADNGEHEDHYEYTGECRELAHAEETLHC